jgi:phosphopantothenoylcysteine synthetase/decarboxylase
MRIFITAGNTQTPIDRVRCITNIFTGRTGAAIAIEAHRRGHHVTLATSHPEVVDAPADERWRCITYRTFEDLETLMAEHIAPRRQDAIVHCAAVSDYHAAGIYAPAPGTRFDATADQWSASATMLNRAAGKVKSDEPELWLRLVRAPKLVDKIRNDWNFQGTLVKFKLEVGISGDALLAIAEASRQQSQADWMVANTLEGAAEWAIVGNGSGYRRVTRAGLPSAVLDALEQESKHG